VSTGLAEIYAIGAYGMVALGLTIALITAVEGEYGAGILIGSMALGFAAIFLYGRKAMLELS